jgi:hypothetical protein
MAVELELNDSDPTPSVELVKGVRIKNVQEKKIGSPGQVAHYHKQEDEVKEWEQACLFVEHNIQNPAGFRINETKYVGTVVVPQCVSDVLAGMESAARISEAGIFQNRGRERFIREFRG